jgi:hypothetical protein
MRDAVWLRSNLGPGVSMVLRVWEWMDIVFRGESLAPRIWRGSPDSPETGTCGAIDSLGMQELDQGTRFV